MDKRDNLEANGDNSELKVDDRVKIAEGSEYYDDPDESGENPLCDGSIVDITPSAIANLTIEVKWDNGCHNSYKNSDLILLNSEQTPDECDATKAK